MTTVASASHTEARTVSESTDVAANAVSIYATDRYVAWWHHLRTGQS